MEISLAYNNSFLGKYKCSSLTLDREERRDEKKRLDHLKKDQTMLVIKRFSERKKENPTVTAGGPGGPRTSRWRNYHIPAESSRPHAHTLSSRIYSRHQSRLEESSEFQDTLPQVLINKNFLKEHQK
ncbi:hypothetical protein Tco_0747063 [Tanacetum coccineum]